MKTTDKSKARIGDFFSQLEQLTPLKRILIASFSIVLLLGAYFSIAYRPQSETISQLENTLAEKKRLLNEAKAKARQIDQFRDEIKLTEEKFKLAMEALPERDEIPALLSGISRSGHEAGMEFLLFEPKGEQFKDFYAEIPVLVKATGSYHQVGRFFEMVARLPRIVNIRDIVIAPPKEGEPLTTSCTAVTYKFVETPPAKKPEEGKKTNVNEKLKNQKENIKKQ